MSADFQKLESLRLFAEQTLVNQVPSLNYFRYDVGYQHFRGKQPLKISVSSSATCALSLVATGNWTADKLSTKKLLEYLLSRKKSAGLRDNNPFTIAWILEPVTALESQSLRLGHSGKIAKMEKVLRDAVKNGGVSIEPYPPSAYLTQLVVRVLLRRSKLTPKLKEAVNKWAWAELARQLALIQAKSKTADAFAVAYLLMLVTAVTPSSKSDPEQTSIKCAALKTFFECQREDGTWPLSRPLFHYPNYGNAYCYEYEMLTQLLQEPELQDLLLEYLPNLSAAAESTSNSVYRVEGGIPAWTSGHHPNQAEPESWATASVYHFIHQFDRLLAEAVRRDLFRYAESPLPILGAHKNKQPDFARGFLDSRVKVHGKRRSLKKFLWDGFVKPLADEADRIAKGRTFAKKTPRSAIFFGPPGTSKTELSKEIARILGWPHLSIDPSLLLRNGMDGIQAEANAIFRRLEQTERVVVLFDEFDELVREREASDAEAFSRFLTTAMLPKLASIHKRATLVFILATNNIGEFDVAIRRQGRFDRVVQIMPPTYKAKISKTDWGASKIDIGAKLTTLGVRITADVRQKIGDLTFGECDDLATELAKASSRKGAMSILNSHWNRCTLQTHVSKAHESKGGETTWSERCKIEAQHNR
jgi:ATPase family protein associated with various cellular activities (AAA)